MMPFCLILLLLVVPLVQAATLVVNTNAADSIVMKEFDHRRAPLCCWYLGCFVIDIIDTDCPFRCERFVDFLDPNQDGATYTYTTPCRTFHESYCLAAFDADDSYVLLEHTPGGAPFPYSGFFQITSDIRASSAATITCTAKNSTQTMDCQDATLNWDSECDDIYTVSINLG